MTLEQDVKAALSKVKLGEVDAALVYRTDAKAAAADVDGIEFPESAERDQRLPDRRAEERAEPGRRAQAFVAYVLSDKGRTVLTDGRVPGPVTASVASPERSRRRAHPAGVPVALLVPAALGLAFLVLPLVGLLVRAPWTHAAASGSTEPGVLDRAAAVAA